MPTPSWWLPNSPHWVRTGVLVAAIIGVATFIVAVVTLVVTVGTQTEPGPAVPPSTTTVPGPATTASSPTTTSPSPTTTPSPTATTPLPPSPPTSEPESAYLADLVPVGYKEPPDYWEPELINGQSYPHSVSASSGGCVRNQETEYQWVLAAKYREMSATIGLNDSTAQDRRVRIEVEVDGTAEFSQDMQAGDEKPVKIDVRGAKRLTVRQIYLGPKPNICSDQARAVWGDAKVTT